MNLWAVGGLVRRRCRLCLLFVETHDSSSVSGIPSSIDGIRFQGS